MDGQAHQTDTGATTVRDREGTVLDLTDPAGAALDLRDVSGGTSRVAAAPAEVGLSPEVEAAVDAERVARRWQLLVALAVLNALDLVTTRAVLDAGGTEANPIMAPIIDHSVAPLAVKALGLLAVGLILHRCPPRSSVVDRALLLVTLGYAGIVSWNLLNLV